MYTSEVLSVLAKDLNLSRAGNMSERTPAFYTARYAEKSDVAFTNDLAATAIEGQGLIYPYTLQYNPDGTVNDPKLGPEDVIKFYRGDSPEAQSGRDIREVLISQPPRTATIWISPPGLGEQETKEYKHTSIQVGSVSVNPTTGLKELNCYGVPSNELTAHDCLSIGSNISHRFGLGLKLEDSESLRQTVFVLPVPNDNKPLEFFRSIIPLPDKWDQIESGEVQMHLQRATEDAYEAALLSLPQARMATNFVEHLAAGTLAESIMMQRGWSFSNLDCDLPNIVILQNTIRVNQVTVGLNGRLRIISTEYKLIQNCGECGKSLGIYMKSGDKCLYCPGTYMGC